MSFKELHFYDEYLSHENNLIEDFYIPVLSETIIFNRAVGYFRSDFLYQISKGMSSIIKNGGVVNIITSPNLTIEDIERINHGYELRKIINDKLQTIVSPPINFEQGERLNYIAHLIANDKLNIKIAVNKDVRKNGMFHEKWGVLKDIHGNKISMNGSNNDTYSGLFENHESFELNFSWLAETDRKRIEAKEIRFDSMWNNKEDSLIVMELPANIKEEILTYKKSGIIDEKHLLKKTSDFLTKNIRIKSLEEDLQMKKINIPRMPQDIKIRDYQQQAFVNWKENEYKGILSMATGTGKTITALNAIVEIFQEVGKLFVIIVCPYQHLVEQWVEDIERFNIAPIIGYSKSRQKEWRRVLYNQIKLFKYSKQEQFTCFITTNATYSKKDIIDVLEELEGNVLFIVDEAHNIGSETGLRGLLDNYKYRMALSATYERKYDWEGTKKLEDYFGKVVYEISIKEAIYEKECLVQYKYYPVPTFLLPEEFQRYKELTKQIGKGTRKTKIGKLIMTKEAKLAANKRALLIAGALNKIEVLKSMISSIKGTKNNLIYCGAANISLEEMPEIIQTDESEIRQVDLVMEMLVNRGINAARFTAVEDVNQRKLIKEQFVKGNIETVVAIKCLDEGVNIPSIERAYILASSKDKKQYIQRRGRVLRKFESWGYKKEIAYIYDFICLPFQLDYANEITDEDFKIGGDLLKGELERIEEFYSTCANKESVENIVKELKDSYFIGGDEY